MEKRGKSLQGEGRGSADCVWGRCSFDGHNWNRVWEAEFIENLVCHQRNLAFILKTVHQGGFEVGE